MPSDSPTRVTVPPVADPDARRRLLRGVAAAVAARGYGATTIADIVRHARVSKRTFYEHFPDKEACYLEAYRRGTRHLGRAMLEAGTAGTGPWETRLRVAVRAYLTVLVRTPASTRAFTAEIQAAGHEAVATRRHMHRQTAEALIAIVDHAREEQPEIQSLQPIMADALVGAMTELVLNAVVDGGPDAILDLEDPIVLMAVAVIAAARRSADGPEKSS